ncbi:pentatricopeptide repeat-containing protein At3g51320-like [Dioscorea cayenensis subsp. rotundata]|uniref:Pentatricopeptide repeat-containing protein At3g51320-like n=1 Tax=Dioscorea cayennensis subsp. rotundata TaxID=55577 RepID=A0AB40C518_DIOCR|nr:pentatricopeptide repeat-containing protein At3g51320-like [Dioscorea cayenensis subsp. rotundata]
MDSIISIPSRRQVSKPSTTSSSPELLPERPPYLDHPSLLPLRLSSSFHHLLQCQAHLTTSSLVRHPFAASLLLKLSCSLAPLPHTLLLFSHLPSTPYLLSFNTLLKSLSLSPSPHVAVSFFSSMLRSGLIPNIFTFLPLAVSCARSASQTDAEVVHAQAIRRGADSVVFCNSLIHAYAACGLVGYARAMFDEMPLRDLVSWNSLVDGYVKVGDLRSARCLFDKMPERNVVSWNIMISGCLKCQCPESGLELFREMERAGVLSDVKTIVSIATACGRLGLIRYGRSVHGYFVRSFREKNNLIFETALVDMYSKCKRVDVARKVFDRIVEKNLVSWNKMILGHCIHACAQDGLALFDEMVQIGEEDSEVKPDETTFVGILLGCSRAGLLDEGRRYFDKMTSIHGLKPTFAHYWCMANLYGGLGMVQEAEEVLMSMPEDTESLVWSTLLGSCRFHGDIELGEQIGKRLIELEPYNSSRYALLLNIYIVAERWEDFEKVKEMMKQRAVKTMPGHSLFDLKEIVHSFKAGDRSQPEMKDIYSMMDEIAAKLKLRAHSHHHQLPI